MGLVEVLLALAMLVLVPLALPLHPGAPARAPQVALVAAVPGAAALALERGALGTILALPWAVVATALAIVATRAWARAPSLRTVPWVAASAYLVVGATWVLFDRADAVVAGFGQPLVQLTAVHFHYAGFASSLLVGCLWRHRPDDRWAAAAAVATVSAPPMVAVGFTWFGTLQVLGAVVLTAGLWVAAVVVVRTVVPTAVATARRLLLLSSLSVWVPMVLAVQWAVGTNLGTPALSIPDMARTHGVLNAVGFALAGVLGWRRLGRAQRPGDTA